MSTGDHPTRPDPSPVPAEGASTGSTGAGPTGSPASAPTRSAEGEVELGASPERVWRALTEAAELERWFPLEARVEPGVGGTIWMSWKNEFVGNSKILAWDPPRHLRISWGAPESEGPSAQVTDFFLEGREGRTTLRVVTSGFPTDASWDDWVEGTRRGWAYELRSLKEYLEHHDGRDRRVVYLRRRVSLPREEAWARLTDEGSPGPWTAGARHVLLEDEPPRQRTLRIGEPSRGLLRLSTEPFQPGADRFDVTLFLATWEMEADELQGLEDAWTRALEARYPDGETV